MLVVIRSGGNQLEDEDFDFYDGYKEQVVDFHGALKEFRDFKLSKSGLFVCCTYVQCKIDRSACGKLRDKNADESWKIIENLALYDHEG
ncbi:hypothetical protein Tco_1161035 [Tanacetum coccineum]